ncbi:DoxX family membrane protein [Bacillus siamensis]|uniref:DoxX family membrane protein n=1 Tax=Bacillus siamensis TaxID=659243 RepID=UPI0018E63A5A|nr:DoxX family membrane protein [Bacillus siamensis]QQD82530.1 DoxX family membrane protein [Bacillus siamensis]
MTLYLRLALGISFLSSAADRFGIWGTPGKPNVVWGNIENHTDYVAALTPFIPDALVPIAGWIATIFETILGILLIIGFKTSVMWSRPIGVIVFSFGSILTCPIL